jgi:hypothetical protein
VKDTILKQTRLSVVDTGKIDSTDRTYAVNWPAERVEDSMIGSVRQLGLVRPIWALERESGLVVADGFRRLAAAAAAGMKSVPVVVLDGKLEPADIFTSRCADVAGRLTPVESARLVKKLRERFDVSEDMLVKTFLPLLGLGASKSVLNKLRQLDRLQEPVARWCAENGVGLRETGLWAGFPRESQRAMLVLVRTLKPGGNLLRSYLELAGEISLRDNVNIEEVLADSRIRKLLIDPQAVASGGRERVHRLLQERRYPTLNTLREQLIKTMEVLGLAGQLKIEPPRLFEGERFTASFEFGSAGELEQVAGSLLNAARSGEAGKLFRLLGAPDDSEEGGR